MKNILLVVFFFSCSVVIAQYKIVNTARTPGYKSDKYITFNPFGLAEPIIAIGAGFGNRFSERSEYFTELSYIAKQPAYGYEVNYLHGVRGIAQYRYHFLNRGRSLFDLGHDTRESKSRLNTFIGLEFRIKPFSFSASNSFVNNATADTLNKFNYQANAVSIGGAILFGTSFNISRNGQWQFETTIGVGAKQKFIHYKNLAPGYQKIIVRRTDLGAPAIDDAVGMPYFPCCFRIKYAIN